MLKVRSVYLKRKAERWGTSTKKGSDFLMKVQRFGRRVSFAAKTLGVFKKLVFCVNRQKMRENLCSFDIGLL